MPLEYEYLGAFVRVPNTRRPVIAAGEDAFAVGTEAYVVRPVGVALSAAEPWNMRFAWASRKRGLMHFEGRDYVGLTRHLVSALVVLGFVATHTERLRGE